MMASAHFQFNVTMYYSVSSQDGMKFIRGFCHL